MAHRLAASASPPPPHAPPPPRHLHHLHLAASASLPPPRCLAASSSQPPPRRLHLAASSSPPPPRRRRLTAAASPTPPPPYRLHLATSQCAPHVAAVLVRCCTAPLDHLLVSCLSIASCSNLVLVSRARPSCRAPRPSSFVLACLARALIYCCMSVYLAFTCVVSARCQFIV